MVRFTPGVLLFTAALVCCAATGAPAPSYTAAAVMHTPRSIEYGKTLQEMLWDNLKSYRGYVMEAAQPGANFSSATASTTKTAKKNANAFSRATLGEKKKADIILFPEAGTGYLSVPHVYMKMMCEPQMPMGWSATAAECQGWDIAVQNGTTKIPHQLFASCISQQFDMDVVINFCNNETVSTSTLRRPPLLAKSMIMPDPAQEHQEQQVLVHYNVDVAFTRHGTLKAKYRKSHLSATGPFLTQPSTPDPVVFESSFGVRFGMFTCYDFWFAEPMRTEMEKMGVTDFLFPSMMASGEPYFTVSSMQQGWSLYYDVNVVGSSAFGNGGVGTYARGQTTSLAQPEPTHMSNAHKIVLGVVPLHPKSSAFAALARTPAHVAPLTLSAVENMKNTAAKKISSTISGDVVQETATSMGPSVCMYGPAPRLNFTYGCAHLGRGEPSNATTFTLQAFTTTPSFSVKCEATVTTARPVAASKFKFVLSAVFVASPDSIGTPSGQAAGMCLVHRCDDPVGGCMGGGPAANWGSDLGVVHIAVTASFGKKFNTAPVSYTAMHPLALFVNSASVSKPAHSRSATPSSSSRLAKMPILKLAADKDKNVKMETMEKVNEGSEFECLPPDASAFAWNWRRKESMEGLRMELDNPEGYMLSFGLYASKSSDRM